MVYSSPFDANFKSSTPGKNSKKALIFVPLHSNVNNQYSFIPPLLFFV